ncbi:MAG: hypothetical protein AAFR38_03365 [Planctomycetota bacterium]
MLALSVFLGVCSAFTWVAIDAVELLTGPARRIVTKQHVEDVGSIYVRDEFELSRSGIRNGYVIWTAEVGLVNIYGSNNRSWTKDDFVKALVDVTGLTEPEVAASIQATSADWQSVSLRVFDPMIYAGIGLRMLIPIGFCLSAVWVLYKSVRLPPVKD